MKTTEHLECPLSSMKTKTESEERRWPEMEEEETLMTEGQTQNFSGKNQMISVHELGHTYRPFWCTT